MVIGIIGTGKIGGNLARLFVKAGHQVIISYSRNEEKLKALANELGKNARVGTIEEASQKTDMIVLSIRFSIMDEVKKHMGDVVGKIIIDTNNPFDIKLGAEETAASEVIKRFPGIKLVKAFNTMYFELLLSKSFQKPLAILPVSGDDEPAKERVKKLIEEIGFIPFDLGNLDNVKLQEVNGPFYNRILTFEEAEKLL